MTPPKCRLCGRVLRVHEQPERECDDCLRGNQRYVFTDQTKTTPRTVPRETGGDLVRLDADDYARFQWTDRNGDHPEQGEEVDE